MSSDTNLTSVGVDMDIGLSDLHILSALVVSMSNFEKLLSNCKKEVWISQIHKLYSVHPVQLPTLDHRAGGLQEDEKQKLLIRTREPGTTASWRF